VHELDGLCARVRGGWFVTANNDDETMRMRRRESAGASGSGLELLCCVAHLFSTCSAVCVGEGVRE